MSKNCGHQRILAHRDVRVMSVDPSISDITSRRGERRKGPTTEVPGHAAVYANSSSNAFASFRSSVSKPSVNQP